jgi:hypothetical protein
VGTTTVTEGKVAFRGLRLVVEVVVTLTVS